MHVRPLIPILALLTATSALLLSVSAAGAQPRPPGGVAPEAVRGLTLSESRVTNPTTGVALWVATARPVQGGDRLPALVLVPGGVSAGSQSLRARQIDARIAQAGFVVVTFDPDGRGRSGGSEDAGGFAHQDGLAAVVRWVATQPAVDPEQIGIISLSYGVTMASGALARYPDLPVRFLIDWEGPDSRASTGCHRGGTPLSHPCDDAAYWAEREAETFLRDVAVPYQRLQSARDHVQPDAHHAVALINAATGAAYGGAGRSPWTRLNDGPPNQTYTLETLPVLPEEDGAAWLPRQLARYARELLVR